METSMKNQENQNPSHFSSPKSHSSNSSTSSSTNNHNQLQQAPSPAPAPIPMTRSEPNNPYPTTFVQADSSSFKQVVQMLTGSSDTAKNAATTRPDPPKNPIPLVKTTPKKERASKLLERRNSVKNFKISPLVPGFVNHSGYTGSPRKPGTPEILSPSMLNFPGLVLSPVTPLISDPFNKSGFNPSIDMEAENKAIAHKGFYLHPSPSNTPRDSEPRLLPLFPVTSPRISGSSNS